MKKLKLFPKNIEGNNENGISIVIVSLLLILFLSISALAIDISNYILVKNELQNAADAGALAGARVLYSVDGQTIQVDLVKSVAQNASTANKALAENLGPTDVEVDLDSDILIGHWAFGLGDQAKGFTPYIGSNPAIPNLVGVSTEDLDEDTNFINAVEATTHRNTFPVASFFRNIIDGTPFTLSAIAVGYIGFAGNLAPGEVDQPIAICLQAITEPDGSYTCSYGRMIPNGEQTGAWTNFSQSPCNTAGGNDTPPLVCAGGNPDPLIFGVDMGTTNGEVDSALTNLIDCWITSLDTEALDTDNDNMPDRPWKLRLPVIDCKDGTIASGGPPYCSKLIGVVTLNVIWMAYNNGMNANEVQLKKDGSVQKYPQYPRYMVGPNGDGGIVTFDYRNDTTKTDEELWTLFANTFDLVDISYPNNNTIVTHEDKSIYFLPECEPYLPTGGTGGQNFGVLAKRPVLVN